MINIKPLLPALLVGLLAFHVRAAGEPNISQPNIPRQTFDITAFDAVGDGKHLNTQAIAAAISAAVKNGGGVVVVPAGTLFTGKISLASKIELRLEAGATLLMSDDATNYRNERKGFDALIVADRCSDIAITGKGTIDGQGKRWWDEFLKTKGTPEQSAGLHRPHLMDLTACTRVRVEGVTFTNSPSFHLVPKSCQDVTIKDVKFKAPASAPNTDALDPSGWNYAITGCTFEAGDDCIAIKASGVGTPAKLSCEHFYIAD